MIILRVRNFGRGCFWCVFCVEAVQLFTQAIIDFPQSATLFANRSEALLRLAKPNAAISDAIRSLELNPEEVQVSN